MPSIAENRPPLFQQFVISSFPVSQCRRDLETRLKIEGERCFVLKPDVYGAIIRGKGQFHVCNDLAFGLRESKNSPIGNFLSSTGAGNFIVSHVASHTGDFGQGCVRSEHRMRPVTLISRLQRDSRTKSKLGHYPAVLALPDSLIHRVVVGIERDKPDVHLIASRHYGDFAAINRAACAVVLGTGCRA
jgi:hypothetical protein